MGFIVARLLMLLMLFALLLMSPRCWTTEPLYVFAVRVSSVSVATPRSAAAGGVCFALRYVPPH